MHSCVSFPWICHCCLLVMMLTHVMTVVCDSLMNMHIHNLPVNCWLEAWNGMFPSVRSDYHSLQWLFDDWSAGHLAQLPETYHELFMLMTFVSVAMYCLSLLMITILFLGKSWCKIIAWSSTLTLAMESQISSYLLPIHLQAHCMIASYYES